MTAARHAPKLPAPRLQLRWKPETEGGGKVWLCHYELVLPLRENDIRAEQEGPRGGRRPNLKELVVPIKEPTIRGCNAIPCSALDGSRYYDAPYRDGAHAQWDAAALGDLPIYVIAPDGVAFSKKDDDAIHVKAQEGNAT